MSAVTRKPDVRPRDIELMPMRRRHVRQVLKIETQVYPRPWSAALFAQEIGRKSDREYLVARHNNEVAGYGGLMIIGHEGHITTIAVAPELQRRGIGMKIMLALVEAAIRHRCKTISLEVRRSNLGAQRLYERFRFRPVGIRRGYYIETGEDAVVMWAEDLQSEEYSDLLKRLRDSLDTKEDD